MNESVNNKDFLEIDVLQLFRALWKRIWLIAISMIVIGGMMFWYSSFIIPPRYISRAMLYVNNSSISVGNTQFSISSQDITAAKSLVNTYVVILKSRNVLEEVIKDTGVTYTYEELKAMVTADSVESTEIFEVRVESTDPKEAERIAYAICRLLPEKVEDVVDGSSVRIVDYPVEPVHKSAPSVTRYTAVGLIIGFVLSSLVIVLLEVFDQYIRGEEYLLQTFSDIPILSVIPDLDSSSGKDRYYYYRHHSKKE